MDHRYSQILKRQNGIRLEELHKLEIFLLSQNLLSISPHILEDSNALCGKFGTSSINNVIGLGPGYDISAEAVPALSKMGYGFIEIGPVTLRPEKRGKSCIGIENGLLCYKRHPDNWGALKIKSNLISSKRKLEKTLSPKLTPLMGINIVPNSESIDLAPYLISSEFSQVQNEFMDIADYIVLNFSGPNKENLLEIFLGEKDRLEKFLNKFQNDRDYLVGLRAALLEESKRPVFEADKLLRQYFSSHDFNITFPQILIKINNDISKHQVAEIAKLVKEEKLDGVIFEPNLLSTCSQEYRDRKKENDWLGYLFNQLGGKGILIYSGNIFSAQDVIDKIKHGASAVQIFPFVLNEGPGAIKDLTLELENELKLLKIENIMDLRGKAV